MIASLVIVWIASGLMAYGTLHSYYQIIRPRYYWLRLIAGLLGGPISLLICVILLLRYSRRLSRD